MLREAVKHQGSKPNLVDNVNEVERSSGNTKSYTLDRLYRERQDLYELVVEGELSARGAGATRSLAIYPVKTTPRARVEPACCPWATKRDIPNAPRARGAGKLLDVEKL